MIREFLKDRSFKSVTYFVCSSSTEFTKLINLFTDENISVINYFGVVYDSDAINEYNNMSSVFDFDISLISITEYNGDSVKMIYEGYDNLNSDKWYNNKDINIINLTMMFRENVLNDLV